MRKWLLYPILTTNSDRLTQGLSIGISRTFCGRSIPASGIRISEAALSRFSRAASLQVKRNIMPSYTSNPVRQSLIV